MDEEEEREEYPQEISVVVETNKELVLPGDDQDVEGDEESKWNQCQIDYDSDDSELAEDSPELSERPSREPPPPPQPYLEVNQFWVG
jgi:hypothetical protein